MARVKLSKLQQAYREFFKALMDEYDVKSPVQLGDKRSEFFNRIKKEWPAAKKKIKEGVLRQEIRDIIVETLKENVLTEKHIPAGSYVWVEPSGKGYEKSYPATKWLKKRTKVKLIDDAPNQGTLDVLDVELSNGREESIYDFNIDKKA